MTHRSELTAWALRVLMIVAAGGLLLAGWWVGQARAGHDPGNTVHVCVGTNGALRLSEACPFDSQLVLATGEGLQTVSDANDALEARVADLEVTVAAQADELVSQADQIADLQTTVDAHTDAIGALEDLAAAQADQIADLQTTVDAHSDAIGALEDLAAAQADQIADLQTTVDAHTDAIGDLEDTVADQAGRVEALEGLLAGVTRLDDPFGRDTLRLEGMNLQVVNGTGTTAGDPNGLGNLIIGYNADRLSLFGTGEVVTEAQDRAGSHYLVVGDSHHWTRFGGLVAGFYNTVSGDWASVSGGAYNRATGLSASVSGGQTNAAEGDWASVSGGRSSWAHGELTSISGGIHNRATGILASVSGGSSNLASGPWASISGGQSNTASGAWVSILGGDTHTVNSNHGCHPSCV